MKDIWASIFAFAFIIFVWNAVSSLMTYGQSRSNYYDCREVRNNYVTVPAPVRNICNGPQAPEGVRY